MHQTFRAIEHCQVSQSSQAFFGHSVQKSKVLLLQLTLCQWLKFFAIVNFSLDLPNIEEKRNMRRGEKHISLSSLVFFFFLVVFHREQQEKKSWYVCTSHSTKYTQKLEKKASSKLTKMKLLYFIQIQSFQPRYNFVFYINLQFSTQIQFCILYKSRVFNLVTILYFI